MKTFIQSDIKKWLSALLFCGTLCAAALTSVVSNHVLASEFEPDAHEQDKPAKQAKPSKHKKSAKPVNHQRRKHPRLRGPMVIIDQLDIDPKQRAQAQLIITEQHQKRMSVHQESRQNRQTTHEKMRQVHQQTIERLGAVLSPEKLKEFEQLLEQHKSQRPPHHRKGKRSGHKSDQRGEFKKEDSH